MFLVFGESKLLIFTTKNLYMSRTPTKKQYYHNRSGESFLARHQQVSK